MNRDLEQYTYVGIFSRPDEPLPLRIRNRQSGSSRSPESWMRPSCEGPSSEEETGIVLPHDRFRLMAMEALTSSSADRRRTRP